MEASLLCELHAHTTWSDGSLELEQVVDLYGLRGFDVFGLERFVSLDRGIGAAVEEARGAGAALIAAHPHGAVPDTIPGHTTRQFWRDAELRSLAHRFELINRHRVFAWVASSGLPAVANGDFHVPEHVDTWKTLLPCARTREAVVGFLRSEAPAALTRVEPEGFAADLRETA